MAKVRTTFLVLAAAAAVFAGNASGQTPPKPAPKADAKPAAPKAATAPKHSVVASASDVKWGPAPPALPAGGQMAVLDGDPSKVGVPFVIRAKLPDGYRIAPHWHPTDENVAVLSGSFSVGMGNKMDEGTMTAVTAGGFVHMPKTMRHYVMTKGETVIQVHGLGPFVVNYVNPADDPRHKK